MAAKSGKKPEIASAEDKNPIQMESVSVQNITHKDAPIFLEQEGSKNNRSSKLVKNCVRVVQDKPACKGEKSAKVQSRRQPSNHSIQ